MNKDPVKLLSHEQMKKNPVLTILMVVSVILILAETKIKATNAASSSSSGFYAAKNSDLGPSSCLNSYFIKWIKVNNKMGCISACKTTNLCQSMVLTKSNICKLYSSSPTQADLIVSQGSTFYSSKILRATLNACYGGHAVGNPITGLAPISTSTSSLFASVSYDQNVKIWDSSKASLVRTTQQVHASWILSTIPLGNNMFASGDREGKALIWNATTGIVNCE
jgi:WD40 repeat protein